MSRSFDSFKIGEHIIGPGNPCLIIGEVAQAHDGSLGMAHAFIDAIANAGADAVKFQTHIAAAESTVEEPWRVKFSVQDKSRYDYWKRMEFTEEQWRGLANHAQQRGLLFLSSPFSLDAVELLIRIGVPAWKIASGEVSSKLMIDRIINTQLPVILSTGMSNISEIDNAVALFKKNEIPLAILQCTSSYPVSPEKVGLNLISAFKERYNCPVGLSDHSGTIFPGLAAAALECNILEVHVTLSREMFGPDVPASITTEELFQLVKGIRFIEKAISNPVDKNLVAEELSETRSLFMKSIVARKDLAAGTILTEECLAIKKPGTGIPAHRLKEIIGLKLRHDIKADSMIKEEDLMEAIE